MTDAGRSELVERLPHALCAGDFAGMHGDAPSGVSPAAKVIDELGSGNACFVACEIEGDELVAESEKRFALGIDGTNAEGSAQNTDELCRQTDVTDSSCRPITYGFDDPLGLEPMRVGHETGLNRSST